MFVVEMKLWDYVCCRNEIVGIVTGLLLFTIIGTAIYFADNFYHEIFASSNITAFSNK